MSWGARRNGPEEGSSGRHLRRALEEGSSGRAPLFIARSEARQPSRFARVQLKLKLTSGTWLIRDFENVYFFTYLAEYQCADLLLSFYSGATFQATGVLGYFRKVIHFHVHCISI